MEKLINKFVEFTYQYKDPGVIMCVCAEECKKIAIDFALYRDKYWNKVDIIHNIPLQSEELFNKFIEEKYGK